MVGRMMGVLLCEVWVREGSLRCGRGSLAGWCGTSADMDFC